MINAQKWFQENYPLGRTCVRKDRDRNNHPDYGKKRGEITDLNINGGVIITEGVNYGSYYPLTQGVLERTLDLSDFINLERLECNNNQLTQIILPQNNQLKKIAVNNNLLTNFDFVNLNPDTLTDLDLHNNNLEAMDISVFGSLINLEELKIGNDNKDRIGKNIYNRFTGSLQSLQNCSFLKELNISNTDIDNGVEYLSAFIAVITFDTQIRSDCRLKRLESELTEFRKDYQSFTYKKSIQKFVLSQSANQTEVIKLREINSKLQEEKEKLESDLKKEKEQRQSEVNKAKETNQNLLIKLNEEIQEIGGELLDKKKVELEQLKTEIKDKLDEKLWSYLDILLLMPDKSEVSEMVKKNLVGQVNGNDLQKLLLFQHEINKLEKRISDNQLQAQIELLPPSYNR